MVETKRKTSNVENIWN